MASADFSAPSFRRYRRLWPFRAGGEISRNKTHFFRSAGCGFTTLLRLGLGLRLVLQTCPQVGLVSAFCAYPPDFASGFLHPRPHGRKLAFGYLVPPNWPIGDLHSRPCVMSCVQAMTPQSKLRRHLSGKNGEIKTTPIRVSFSRCCTLDMTSALECKSPRGQLGGTQKSRTSLRPRGRG